MIKSVYGFPKYVNPAYPLYSNDQKEKEQSVSNTLNGGRPKDWIYDNSFR
jgi:hypothetical protein